MPIDTHQKKELLTVEDFCTAFSISRPTFYKQVKLNKLKIKKLGTRTYIIYKEAIAWAEALEDVE